MEYEKYLSEIDKKAGKLIEASDTIWDCAELAFSEYQSAEILKNLLRGEGFEVMSQAYDIETAFTGKYGNGRPYIGILGEFDALGALNQIADLPEKRADHPGANGHGCGHNLLGTGSMAAAIAIKKYLEETKCSGTVIYYGCPGEEGGSGKAFMAREGAFSDLDFALSWHPAELNSVNKDSSLANIEVLYKFSGISAHAAGCPELGRSALDALELMNVGTNFIREHMSSQARIHYAITNPGGISPNVVQNHAEVLYLIRAPKAWQAQELFERVNKIANGMAMATETKVEYQIIKKCANLIPNTVIEKELFRSMKQVSLPEYSEDEIEYAKKFTASSESGKRTTFRKYAAGYMEEQNKTFMKERIGSAMYNFVLPYEETHIASCNTGSTDVGDVSFMCPTSQIAGCTWAPDSGGHSWQIVAQGKSSIAHKGLLYAGKVMAATAIHMLENPEQIKAARTEYEERMKDETYLPIPPEIKPRPISSLV